MQRQRFSLRKYKFGLASVLLGTALVFGAGQAQADEQAIASSSGQVQPTAAVVSATESASQAATPESQPASSATVEKAPASSESAASSTDQVSQPSTAEAKEAAAAPVEKGATSSSEEASSSAEKVTQPSATQTKPTAPASSTAESPSAANSEKPAANPDAVAESPTSRDAKPSSISTNEIIKVPQTWSQGYKGQGRVVAIIDSGLDVHHEVLKISDPSKAKYQTEAALEEAKKKAGIDYGKWYNNKVVYAYNYIDGDDNIKEKNSYSHGMHVTGITAGNPNKKAPNDEYVYGVAPEAQVMFMRVFSDRQRTTSDAIYIKAIDDAVALGADTINMSLG